MATVGTCKRCGSENVTAQVVNKVHYKQGHGCLAFIFFGLIYVLWIPIKWITKYLVYLSYWVVWGWISLIISKARKTTFRKPEWVSHMMRKRGRNYNTDVTYMVCNNCGYKAKV